MIPAALSQLEKCHWEKSCEIQCSQVPSAEVQCGTSVLESQSSLLIMRPGSGISDQECLSVGLLRLQLECPGFF